MITYNKETPVLLVACGTIESVVQIFNELQQIKPRRLYLAYDAPATDGYRLYQEQVASVFSGIDWDCQIQTLRNKTHLGYDKTMRKAVRWFFRRETEGIVLDCRNTPYPAFGCIVGRFNVLHGNGIRCCVPAMHGRKYWGKWKKPLLSTITSVHGDRRLPGHPFMKQVIRTVFDHVDRTEFTGLKDKGRQVLESTGPLMLVNLYERYDAKEDVYIIPYEYVSPLANFELYRLRTGKRMEDFEHKLEKAYVVHYFFNGWLINDK